MFSRNSDPALHCGSREKKIPYGLVATFAQLAPAVHCRNCGEYRSAGQPSAASADGCSGGIFPRPKRRSLSFSFISNRKRAALWNGPDEQKPICLRLRLPAKSGELLARADCMDGRTDATGDGWTALVSQAGRAEDTHVPRKRRKKDRATYGAYAPVAAVSSSFPY